MEYFPRGCNGWAPSSAPLGLRRGFLALIKVPGQRVEPSVPQLLAAGHPLRRSPERLGASVHVTVRPSLAHSMSPASSSARRCFMKPASDIACGAASSLTLHAPRPSISSVSRLVACDSAANTASRSMSSYLTIWFSVLAFCRPQVKTSEIEDYDSSCGCTTGFSRLRLAG